MSEGERELEAPQEAPEQINDLPPMGVSGNFIDRVSIIHSSSMSLVFTTGILEDKVYALPFLDWTLEGSETESLPFTALMTLDNMAFVLSTMAGNIEKSCRELAVISAGSLAPEPSRMELTRKLLAQAERSISEAHELLERLADR